VSALRRAGLPVMLLAAAVAWLPQSAAAALRVVIVEGLGGEPVYATAFAQQGRRLVSASQTLTGARDVHLLAGANATRSAVLALLHSLAHSMSASDRLILYLIGHGSFDGRQYKFNVPGPDLTTEDIRGMLNALPARAQLVVATGSSSGALLAALSRAGRVVVTATRNGDEKNVTQFGAEFAAALGSGEADTNKNQAISVREAFDYANRRVQDHYRQEKLLATEHAQLQGGEAATFTVASLVPAAGSAAAGAERGERVPPALAQQRQALNARIQALEARKTQMDPAAYTAQLQQLLIELAQLQRQIDRGDAAGPAGPAGSTGSAPPTGGGDGH
jgi:hypothetical protein